MSTAPDKDGAIRDLEHELDALAKLPEDRRSGARIEQLQSQLNRLRQELLDRMTAYDKVQLARHPKRPYFLDYVPLLFEEFEEWHGDRKFGDDPAIVTGFALFQGQPVCLVGQEKGRGTKGKLYRNFGMPKPEGYRKAFRVMNSSAWPGRV